MPPNHQPFLKESIHRFLAHHRRGATDFSDFSSIFSRLLHSTPDPPIPTLWFYSALQSPITPNHLFHLLLSCSATCASTKRIAALAPLLFLLHRHVLRSEPNTDDAETLIDGIISYISILCGGDDDDDNVAFVEGDFVDVIPVWMVGDGDGDVRDCVERFFPFASDDTRKRIENGCEVGVLAGVVMCEVLLMKLWLVFEKGNSRTEVEEKLFASAVQTITGFRKFRFCDTLFRMMLEPVLPVISVLGSENEVLLNEVLYKSVMMVEYSFINPQPGFSPNANSLKDFAITWLFVAESAVQSAREKGDQGKAMSYINAFCRSCIPTQLINWVTNRSCASRKISRPNVSTPIALIKWLLVIEELGLEVFVGETAKHHAKANLFASRTKGMLPVIKQIFNNLDSNCFLNSIHGEAEADELGDIEMLDKVDTLSLAADDCVNTACIDGTRKRKEGIEDDAITQLKYMRCQFHENSIRGNSFIFRQQ